MKMYATLLLLICFSCNTNKNKNAENSTNEKIDSLVNDTSVQSKTLPVSEQACYLYNSGKDSIYLKINKTKDSVTGNLMYDLYEKDRNNGDVKGKFYGDTLVADYNFMSEGVQSTRQIIFIIKNAAAIEGHGEMHEANGKFVFDNRKKAKFDYKNILLEIDCR